MKKTRLILLALACLVASGCASFSTVQIDKRNETETKITTKAKSWTFWEADSSLAKWRAIQSEKSQSAFVGGLEQAATATNTVTIIGNALELGRMLRPTP